MTHPSVEGQVDVIKSAYLRANLSPDETSYVECHGTGTPVGDPIEVEAIHKAMGNSTSRRGPVLIGSVCLLRSLSATLLGCAIDDTTAD